MSRVHKWEEHKTIIILFLIVCVPMFVSMASEYKTTKTTKAIIIKI